MTYDIPPHRRGDTWDGINKIGITINNVPVNLLGSKVVMELREDYDAPVALTLSTDTSTILILPDLSSIQVLPTKIDVQPGTYKYDLQVTYPNAQVKTYLEGTWQIYFDITA
jgi:hypothetical protein